ncbi:MAG: RDD family protein [Pirellulales bacterium]|nr:RDD family protein [Pirellulales bacterium]
MDTQDRQLDTRIEVITPENIAFRYRVAGPFRRLPAFLIDVVIQLVAAIIIQLVLFFVFDFVGLLGIGIGLYLIFFFILMWFYGGLFEALWNGQTPGKRIMGIRVLSIDGKAIDAIQATLRNVLRIADFQPVLPVPIGPFIFPVPCCLLGLVTASFNDRFQRLGDLACGTMVVVESRPGLRDVMRIDDREALRLADQIPAYFVPSRTLARALATYVGRRWAFSPGRRQHIASHLAGPLYDRLGLPPNTDPDQLLCAVYYRTFIADRQEEGTAETALPAVGRQSGVWGNTFDVAEPTAMDIFTSVNTGRRV